MSLRANVGPNDHGLVTSSNEEMIATFAES